MKYTEVKIKDVCSYRLFEQIKNHAIGSLYRLNAKTADCYAFSITKDGENWEGCWDWLNELVSNNEEFILMLDNKKVYKIN